MHGRHEMANYQETGISFYRGNPLIEALPAILTEDEVLARLRYDPVFTDADRQLPAHWRLHLIQQCTQFFMPLSHHFDLEQSISRMLRQGLVGRNPANPNFWWSIDPRLARMKPDALYIDDEQSAVAGFTVIGISGIGKSRAIARILSQYPQVIYHKRYQGRPLPFEQICWLKLECPFDGSTKGLCQNFFQELDKIMGTKYWDTYARRGRATRDEMLPHIARVCLLHGLGAMVIDELQNLSEAKNNGSREMLNFFVQLQNSIGVPIILIGTYKARSLLTKEFRQARRGTGQGDMVWDRMQEDETWDIFAQALWKYQYVQEPSALTSTLKHTLYDVSQGITDIAVKVYLLAQARAINNGDEKVTSSIMRSVALDSFRMVAPALDALRRNKLSDLQQFEDIAPVDLSEAIAHLLAKVPIVVAPPSPATPDTVRQASPDPGQPSPEPALPPPPTAAPTQTKPPAHDEPAEISPAPEAEGLLQSIVATAKSKKISAYAALQTAGYIRPAQAYLHDLA